MRTLQKLRLQGGIMWRRVGKYRVQILRYGVLMDSGWNEGSGFPARLCNRMELCELWEWLAHHLWRYGYRLMRSMQLVL